MFDKISNNLKILEKSLDAALLAMKSLLKILQMSILPVIKKKLSILKNILRML